MNSSVGLCLALEPEMETNVELTRLNRLDHQPTSKTRGKEFRPKRISVERKDLAGPVNGRWLANLSAWGKVIEFTAEMQHNRSEIRWLHTTLEFERRKTNLNVLEDQRNSSG